MGRSQAALLDQHQRVLDEMMDDAATWIEGASWSAGLIAPEGDVDLAARQRTRGVP